MIEKLQQTRVSENESTCNADRRHRRWHGEIQRGKKMPRKKQSIARTSDLLPSENNQTKKPPLQAMKRSIGSRKNPSPGNINKQMAEVSYLQPYQQI